MVRIATILLLIVSSIVSLQCQRAKTSSEIREGMDKLKVLGSVMYIAAHPDDENTRLITYLSKGMHLRTAYLSLTRGDGGQNLIGPELDEYLGVIRTQELLEARNIDGGIQLFTRANDFGFSRNAEETFSLWQKDSILADVLRAVRVFKPDVIINRFDHRSSGKTHGHHTASAILGKEAFQYSNSPLFMRNVLGAIEPHIVQRLFFNTSWFFYGSKEKFDSLDKSNLYQLDVGAYYPAYGYSNNELAAQSRSMHKSQGFGINSARGSQMEYFERLDGGKKESQYRSPFDGLDFSWYRVNGGGIILAMLDSLTAQFDEQHVWKSIPLLQRTEQAMKELPDHNWKQLKIDEIQQLIFDCAGLYLESTTQSQIASPGMQVNVQCECIVRNPIPSKLLKIEIPAAFKDSSISYTLQTNQSFIWNASLFLPDHMEYTSPFWLMDGRPLAMYPVFNPDFTRLPEKPRTLKTRFHIQIGNATYLIDRDVSYKNDDPVLGEVRGNFDILPPCIITADDFVFLSKKSQVECQFKVRSVSGPQKIQIELNVPAGLKIISGPNSMEFKKAGELQTASYILSIDPNAQHAVEIPVLINGQKAYILKAIKYPHIKQQNVLLPAKLTAVCTPVLSARKRIAYLEGAGDIIDESLQKMGYEVRSIRSEDLMHLNRKEFDVLVMGIRALNNKPELENCMDYLLPFMESGGKVIMQYNTTADLVSSDLAPAQLKIGRSRVTDEHAPVKILKPDHSVLHSPNQISVSDFDGWIQERGLYFPETYDKSFDEILSMNDAGQPELRSGLLIRKTGKGYYIYTPLSFFRQLKSGVPGAFKLFSNIISF